MDRRRGEQAQVRQWLDDMTAALDRRDLSTLQHELSNDIVLRLAGNSQLSGAYRGPGQVMGLVARTSDWATVASIDFEPMPDDRLRLSVDVQGERRFADARLRVEEMIRFDDLGKVSEAEVWSDDQQVLDNFLDLVAAEPGLRPSSES